MASGRRARSRSASALALALVGLLLACDPSAASTPHAVRASVEPTRDGTFATSAAPEGPPTLGSTAAVPRGTAAVAERPDPAREGGPVGDAAFVVNPFLAHAKEPAPMGVADFGVTGSGPSAEAYDYATSAFEGTAQVQSMKIAATSGKSTYTVAAFELNAVMVLQRNGTNYTYWIQNGLHVNTTSNEYTIGGAYVWNFSSPSAHLSSGELRGNASSVLVSDSYYFIPGCGGFAGQCSVLSLPATLTARIALGTCDGFPCVEYQYDLGVGWVTYDAVSFLHMAGATELGFVVDGHAYTPRGTGSFYDAEWDWVAAGGGLSGRDLGSALAMGLDLWNGYNYQPVPAAWNFGGDTGESSFNITEVLNRSGPSGAPLAELSSGAGSLGVLYNQSAVGFLNVTAPVPTPDALFVNGSAVPLRNGTANLTLLTGTYRVALQNYSNATEAVTILPGQVYHLNLSGAGLTSFEERGLPVGTVWGVTVDNVTRSGSPRVLAFNLPNGTYPLAYAKVPGFFRNASDPVELGVPYPSPVQVGWSAYTFAVSINETGLPTGTPWWVNVSGTVTSGNGSSLEVAAPNGTTPFQVGAPYEFVASPTNGSIDVDAGSVSPVNVLFAYRPTYIAGTVAPAAAELTIGGVAQTVSGGRFNDSVIPGSYTLVASAAGYATQTISVLATPGNVTVEQIQLVLNSTAGSNGSRTVSPPPSADLSLEETVGLAVVVVAVLGALAYVVLRRRRG